MQTMTIFSHTKNLKTYSKYRLCCLNKSNIIQGFLCISTYVCLFFQAFCSGCAQSECWKTPFSGKVCFMVIFSQNSITQHQKKNELDSHCYCFCHHVGLLESNFNNYRPLGILQHPTLVWFRNLKGRNIRPYPIKLWRICMYQEKSVFVIYICDIALNRQAYGQRHRLQTSITGLIQVALEQYMTPQ